REVERVGDHPHQVVDADLRHDDQAKAAEADGADVRSDRDGESASQLREAQARSPLELSKQLAVRLRETKTTQQCTHARGVRRRRAPLADLKDGRWRHAGSTSCSSGSSASSSSGTSSPSMASCFLSSGVTMAISACASSSSRPGSKRSKRRLAPSRSNKPPLSAARMFASLFGSS